MAKRSDKRHEPIRYHYMFKFHSGRTTAIEVRLDPSTLNCIVQEPSEPKPREWTQLGFHQCVGCPLDVSKHEYCPVARNIATMTEAFTGCAANESVHVTVYSARRDYMKSTSLQEGLTALLGLYMASSGCPVMDKLKPLVRYHLPFASLDEHVTRVAGIYLLIQYMLERRHRKPDWQMKNLPAIYERIQSVNAGILKRLRHGARMDASLTALASLESTASLVPFMINETLEEIEESLKSYFVEE